MSFTDDFMIVHSNGIPNHPTGTFPNPDNPNSIREQDLRFFIPLHPRKADKPISTPFGPIGVAVNGIPFFNQYNREGEDAVRRRGQATAAIDVVPQIYAAYPEALHAFAARSVQAHLDKLVRDGRARRVSDDPPRYVVP